MKQGWKPVILPIFIIKLGQIEVSNYESHNVTNYCKFSHRAVLRLLGYQCTK